MIQQTIERRDKNMEKKEERRFTEEKLEQCRKVLEDRGYTASLDLGARDGIQTMFHLEIRIIRQDMNITASIR